MIRIPVPELSGWTLTNPVRLALDLMGLALALVALGAMLWARDRGAGIPALSLALPASQALLFAVSAIYHGIDWTPEAKARWQRADHSMIYIKVAGTATALFSVLPEEGWSELALAGIWLVAMPGVAQKVWWPSVPMSRSMGFSFMQSLMALPIVYAFFVCFPGTPERLLLGAMVFYLVGFAVFAAERPRFWPGRFCHHDFFHVMLLGAALCLYAALAHGPLFG